MFTPEGELREGFRHLEGAPEAGSPPSGSTVENVAAGGRRTGEPAAGEPAAGEPAAGARIVEPDETEEATASRQDGDAPQFLDLVGFLAENASVYLRQASSLGSTTEGKENLEIAKLHIDFLRTLQEKTTGNLTAEESAMLEDVIYQLKMGFVSLRGF